MDLEETDNPQDTPQRHGDWFSVYYRNSKRIVVPESHNGAATTTSLDSKLHPKRSRLPPLPRQDYKVVLRPREGLNLGQWKPHHVARGIALACNNHPCCAENRLIVRINLTQNVAVISTPHAETADLLRKITHIKLADNDHGVFAYVAANVPVHPGIPHGSHSDCRHRSTTNGPSNHAQPGHTTRSGPLPYFI